MPSSTEFQAPPDSSVREQLRSLARRTAENLAGGDLSAETLESLAVELLKRERLPLTYQGWLMVILASCFWQPQIQRVPFHRRLLLLPAGPKPGDKDPGYVGYWRLAASHLGYHIIADDQWEQAEEFVRSGQVDAVLGVAGLRGLERAMERVMKWGLPCMAEPVFATHDQSQSVDQVWVERMIDLPFDSSPEAAAEQRDVGGRHRILMQAARELFHMNRLEQWMPRTDHSVIGKSLTWLVPAKPERARSERNGCNQANHDGNGAAAAVDPCLAILPNPLNGTATIAYDFVARGGKYSRPFITLAVYDALTGNLAEKMSPGEMLERWSLGVKRTAMSIEVFHKASLVHDDIEDDDDCRYGQPSVHRRYGIATAINVGDFLVGMGYRLVSGCTAELGGTTVAQILDCLADAHQRLSEGQGAELLWRDQADKNLSPTDALRVYGLKTAPAFEVAFFSGLRLAGVAGLEDVVKDYSVCLGVAFQILNDLKDWCEDERNKGISGGDVLGGRPTLLWALALEAASAQQRGVLLELVSGGSRQTPEQRLNKVRQLYQELGVFRLALGCVEKLERQANEIVASLSPEELKPLMRYLIRAVLQRPRQIHDLLAGRSANATV